VVSKTLIRKVINKKTKVVKTEKQRSLKFLYKFDYTLARNKKKHFNEFTISIKFGVDPQHTDLVPSHQIRSD
jgi:hypothetical protein